MKISWRSATLLKGSVAFTRTELVVVVVVILVVAIMGSVIYVRPRTEDIYRDVLKTQKITCVNNLKEIGTAYRIWANDNGNKYPFETPATNGGWRELLSRGSAGPYCWTNYALMQYEMGQSTRCLICPTDKRQPAADFGKFTNNTALSYFVGVHANDAYPRSILGGDRNLGPGTVPDSEYGFSPPDGRGNDVLITGPVCWSRKMHWREYSDGGGTIVLGDGSVQQVTTAALRTNLLQSVPGEFQARADVTNSAGIRLIFP